MNKRQVIVIATNYCYTANALFRIITLMGTVIGATSYHVFNGKTQIIVTLSWRVSVAVCCLARHSLDMDNPMRQWHYLKG